MEQVDIFTILREREPKPEPLLSIGQKIYIVSLDTVRTAKIERRFTCEENSDNPYYGYSLKYEKGLHDTIWDFSIGKKAFLTKAEAIAKAERCQIPTIEPSELEIVDGKGFEYIRECDARKLTAFVGKVGDNQLYEYSYCTYHFLRTYKDTKSRNKAYKDFLVKIEEEGEAETENPGLEKLYYVNSNLYASRDYAERHTIHGKEC